MAELRVGTSGYNYKEWKGNFYPPKLSGRPSVIDSRRLRGKMVLALQDEGVTIKWLERIGDQWVLTAENKDYPQRLSGPDDHIIGRVAWWHHHQE